MFCEESGCENYISHRASMGDTIEWVIKCRACPNPKNEFRFPLSHGEILKHCAERRTPYIKSEGKNEPSE